MIYKQTIHSIGRGATTRLRRQAGPIRAHMFPFATFVGTLLALGRLGTDRELTAPQAFGVSAIRWVGPVVGFAAAMSVAAILAAYASTPDWTNQGVSFTLASV